MPVALLYPVLSSSSALQPRTKVTIQNNDSQNLLSDPVNFDLFFFFFCNSPQGLDLKSVHGCMGYQDVKAINKMGLLEWLQRIKFKIALEFARSCQSCFIFLWSLHSVSSTDGANWSKVSWVRSWHNRTDSILALVGDNLEILLICSRFSIKIIVLRVWS